MDNQISTTAAKWQEELARGGYANTIKDWKDFTRLTRLSRTWRYILNATNLKPGAAVFEFGCGGGNQLVPLALRGYRCCGIDCSQDVLIRCRRFISDVEKFAGKTLDIQFVCGDFLSFFPQDNYDLVFNFGVIEHFLDNSEREMAIQKMFRLCKPGGYVISVVPNGRHPLRKRMRKEGLGGYRIPEIDYDCALMTDEMRRAGAATIKVVPHNLFGYLMINPSTGLYKLILKLCYYLWQLVPLSIVPMKFSSKHAYGLIAIAKKPVRAEK